MASLGIIVLDVGETLYSLRFQPQPQKVVRTPTPTPTTLETELVGA